MSRSNCLVLRPIAVAIVAAMALTFVAIPASAQSDIKIAVVDLETIVAQSQAGKELAETLKALEATARTEIQGKQQAANDLRQRIADGANSLSEDKLTEIQKQYEDAMIDIRRFTDDKQREGQKTQAEGLRRIEQQLEPVFEAVKAEGSYDLILNKVPGVVVMAGERVDITEKVIEKLNAPAQ